MCVSMVDIQSATAEIRQGKKEERRTKPQGKNIMAPLLHRAAIKRSLMQQKIKCGLYIIMLLHLDKLSAFVGVVVES